MTFIIEYLYLQLFFLISISSRFIFQRKILAEIVKLQSTLGISMNHKKNVAKFPLLCLTSAICNEGGFAVPIKGQFFLTLGCDFPISNLDIHHVHHFLNFVFFFSVILSFFTSSSSLYSEKNK